MLSNVPTFQNFWNAYDLKRDRLRAERAWQRLSTADKRNAVAGIAAYREDCDRRGISRMYAQGYLNNRRWEDDFSPVPPCNVRTVTSPTPSQHTSEEHSADMEEW